MAKQLADDYDVVECRLLAPVGQFSTSIYRVEGPAHPTLALCPLGITIQLAGSTNIELAPWSNIKSVKFVPKIKA